MEEKQFKFRDGFNWKIEPEIAGREIEKIAALNNNELTPQALVEEARKNSSPLHPLFDWNNKVAGEKWRLQQARQLIASLVIEITITSPEEVRAFVNITLPEKGNAYCSIQDVMNDDEKLQLVIEDAKRKLGALAKQLRVYEKLRKVALKIDELILEMV